MIVVCANCKKSFGRGYNISAKRAAKPQYCSPQCVAERWRKLSIQNAKERFWAKVSIERPDACWEWRAQRDVNGYGRFTFRRGLTTMAHRWAYMLHYGVRLSREQLVCHSCDNPGCCNPFHLWIGDDAKNAEDRERKGRGRPGVVLGERHHATPLTTADVLNIRASRETAKSLAPRYGVSATAIRNIRARKTWRHV